MPDEPALPDVVVGVVTSSRSVLIGRRADGVPPWVFPGGKIEQGESPGDAVIREVREETGLDVAVSGEIGRRVHPATRRKIIYLASRRVVLNRVVRTQISHTPPTSSAATVHAGPYGRHARYSS